MSVQVFEARILGHIFAVLRADDLLEGANSVTTNVSANSYSLQYPSDELFNLYNDIRDVIKK